MLVDDNKDEDDEVVVLIPVLVVDGAMVEVYGMAVPSALIEANASCVPGIWNSPPTALSQLHGALELELQHFQEFAPSKGQYTALSHPRCQNIQTSDLDACNKTRVNSGS